MSLFVRVAVPRPLAGLFEYHLPKQLLQEPFAQTLRKGEFLRVPFGRTTLNAILMDWSETRTTDKKIEIKEVSDRLDSRFNLSSELIQLAQFGSDYYQYPLGEALFSMTPPHPEKILSTREKKKSEIKTRQRSLNSDQKEAYQKILNEWSQDEPRPVLIEGVTGSGKTEVYIELAKEILKKNQSVIILVPEIALTAQLRDRFEQGLGEEVVLVHSALAEGLRQTQWVRMSQGEIRVVLGARSAVFSPVQNLGLIVVDEEHDASYKQEERFRYHARDLALFRTKKIKAQIILGSATPSFETLENVRRERFFRVELLARHEGAHLPEIDLVSLRDEPCVFNEKVKTVFAEKTIQKIQQTIDRGEQVLVYLNRRGFSHFILCKDCGEIESCPDCSISLTHYQKRTELRCHICGYRSKPPLFCKKCGSHELEGVGAGTEALEDELAMLLEGAKIVRLDRDLMTSQKRLEEALQKFRNLEFNVMVGTQMIVKGHDFPEVTLVVVVQGDLLLKWPDFRSSERALQTLEQVSGRAGRALKKGQVLIQTYDLDHPVLQVLLGLKDKKEWIQEELELRQMLLYPPFSRMMRLRLQHENADFARQCADKMAQKFQSFVTGEGVLGPSEAILFRAQKLFRFDFYYKASRVEDLMKLGHLARKLAQEFDIELVIDVDPYHS